MTKGDKGVALTVTRATPSWDKAAPSCVCTQVGGPEESSLWTYLCICRASNRCGKVGFALVWGLVCLPG